MRDYLRRAADDVATLEAKRAAIEDVRDQIAMIEAEMCSARGTGYGSAPVAGGGNRQEQRLCAYIDRKIKLEERERELKVHVRRVERAMKDLNDQEQRVIDAMYCRGTSKGTAVRRLEEELYVSTATIYRIRERALWKIACRLGYAE